MRTRFSISIILILLVGLFSPLSLAMQQAARTGVSTLSPCPSFCGGSNRVSASDNDGGVGFVSSFSSVDHPTNGHGRAQAELVGGGIGLPILRADAFSNANSRVSSSATSMQNYVYNGPTSNFTLDLTLDGTVIDGTQPPDASLTANVVIVLASNLGFASDYGTFRFEVVELTPGVSLLDEIAIDFFSLGLFDSGPQSAMGSASFVLNDGDEIFVWANLTASGTRGGSADSFSTAALSFSEGNVAGISAVPLPAPLWLVFSGLVVALRVRR